MKIVTVLRTKRVLRSAGGPLAPGHEFHVHHVQALKRQFDQYAPGNEFVCLADVVVPGVTCIPLKTSWPGWWAKMELFEPSLRGDFLFVDLDTVIVGDLSDILAVDKLTLLRDFYRDGRAYKEGLGSGFMFLPEVDRVEVWDRFSKNPEAAMVEFYRGDQRVLEWHYAKRATRWQDVVPGQVVSYKVHCCQNLLGAKEPVFIGVPKDARIICFHGPPRPWRTQRFEDLYQ